MIIKSAGRGAGTGAGAGGGQAEQPHRRRDGENAQKTGKNGEKTGEIRPKNGCNDSSGSSGAAVTHKPWMMRKGWSALKASMISRRSSHTAAAQISCPNLN